MGERSVVAGDGAVGDGAELRGVAEAALRSSETAIVIADQSIRLVWVNAAFLRLWGYARAADVLGRHGTEFWSDADQAEGAAAAILRDGRWQGELVARRADGGEAAVRASANAFTDRNTGAVRIVGTFDDVTELRAAQEHLVRAQRIAQLGYWSLQLSTGEVACSDEAHRILGLGVGELPGTLDGLLRAAHPDDLAAVRRAVERLRATGHAASLEFRVPLPAGGERVVHIEAALVRDRSGAPLELRGIVQDVTVRVRLEEQLRQSQKMEAVGSLAGGIAHDFNNLLTVILSLGCVAADGLPPESPVRADLDEIVETARRAEGLTRQILAFARRQVSEPVQLDLNAAVAGATKLVERLIGAHIAVRLSLAPGLAQVHADPRQLEQVLMNLAVNARDAMPTGGTLAISTFALPPLARGASGRIELVVRDSGTGMDAETRARAFDPFFTTKGPGCGTGLGLAVVHNIVQQCGGTVTIESSPGCGTAVRIVFPARGGATRPAGGRAELGDPVAGAGRTVLLVEDEEPVRRVATRCLERAGYRVLAVADGEDALRLAATAGPLDLLLTDIMMPGMSGPRVADALRAARPKLPVLFMSGFSRDLPESLAPPPGSLLQKPFTPEVLVARVAEAIAGPAPGIVPPAS